MYKGPYEVTAVFSSETLSPEAVGWHIVSTEKRSLENFVAIRNEGKIKILPDQQKLRESWLED